MSIGAISQDASAEPDAPPPTVFDLLARTWDTGGPTDGVAVDNETGTCAFSRADGTVAIVSGPDPEPASARIRIAGDVGHMSILQRTQSFGALIEAGLVAGERTALAPLIGGRGFVVGTGGGTVKQLTAGGIALDIAAPFRAAVDAVCSHPSEPFLAAAAGLDVVLIGEAGDTSTRRLSAPAPVRNLAFSPDGKHLGATTDAGLWLVPLQGGSPVLIACEGLSAPLSWDLDGAFVAAGRSEAGMVLFRLADRSAHRITQYPAAVRSIAWSAPAHVLATSGAFRAVAWAMAALPVDGDKSGALIAGRSGLVLVEAVASHPRRRLLAVGYANGLVALASIGTSDEMVLYAQEGAAVAGLAFIGEGDALAIAHADGKVAVVGLPAQLFK